MTASVAFVTVSYRLDRDRCVLLSRSLDALAPSVEHYIVVDRGDRRHFSALENRRTTLLTKEEVLPIWLQRVDTLRLGFRSTFWVQARGKPNRGWLVQQLVKLALAEKLGAGVLVYADSDVVLMRPFELSSIIDREGNVRLCSQRDAIDAGLPNHVRWHRNAERLLGIGSAEFPLPDFISGLVPWRRDNAVALLEHVERTTGRPWLRAIAAASDVSEYTLYGRFVTDLLGGAGQFTGPSLCHDYYTRSPLSGTELEAFLDRLAPDQIAVNITAKAKMDPADYADAIERRWTAVAT
jgi:hypothetical protein